MKSILVKLCKLFSVRMLAIGLTFLQTIAITQVFGSEVFGLLSFALSISALLVLVLSAGLDQVLMRDIARIGKDVVAKSERWKDIWRLIKRFVLPVTLFVTLGGGMTVTYTPLAGAYQQTLLVVFILLPVILSRKYLEAMCQGTKQVIRSIMGSQIVYPLLMILGAAYVWCFGVNPNSITMSFVYAVALTGSMFASVLLIAGTLKKIGANTDVSTIDNELHASPGERKLFLSGIHLSLVSLGFVLGQHIDVLLMGVLSTPEDVALVRVAARVAEIAGLMRAIIILQYKPLMAEAYGKGDLKLLQQHATFMVKIFLATGIPITIGLWIFAENVMLVFGSEFVAGAWAMRIYILGVLFLLLCGPCNSILALTDNEKKAGQFVWVAIIVNIALDILLIPEFGAIGCGFANMFSMMVLGILSVRYARKKLNIETTILSVLNYKV
tara:strand:+ start:8128 stop:9447 length:1320 start_codon:yes stop_codon:yes gene_type:complete